MTIVSFDSHTPEIHESVFVDPTALILGDVKIGADSSIWPMAVIRGDMHSIRIGNNTSIQDGSVLHITHDSKFSPGGHPLNIGDNVTLGHKVILHGCEVQNNCVIGMGATVLDGAIVETNVILGANSLVTSGKVLHSGYLYMGSPAKQIRPLTEEELEFIPYSASNYVKLKNQHIESLR